MISHGHVNILPDNRNDNCPPCGEEGHIKKREVQCEKNQKFGNCGKNHLIQKTALGGNEKDIFRRLR